MSRRAPVGPRWAALAVLLAGCGLVTEKELSARFDLDGDGVPRPLDCDDADAEVGEIRWFADRDLDGFGDPDAPLETSCVPRSGLAISGGDCDDARADVAPGLAERCDGADNDCDGDADEDPVDPLAWYLDADGDGYGDPTDAVFACSAPEGRVGSPADCDDKDAAVGAGQLWFEDADGDGWGDPDSFSLGCAPPAGFIERSGDCDDADPDVAPSRPEVCDPFDVDEDCDGLADDADRGEGLPPRGLEAAWVDADGDGLGDARRPAEYCDPPDGYAANREDCDDGDPSVGAGDCPFVAVSAGGGVSCGLRSDLRPECWGDPSVVAEVPPDATFVEVAAGEGFACGLSLRGELSCWGPAAPSVDDTFAPVSQIDAEADNLCGLTKDGGLACWRGEVVTSLRLDLAFTAMTAGAGHACAATSAGGALCFGQCRYGECLDAAGGVDAVAAGAGVTCRLNEGAISCDGLGSAALDDAGPVGSPSLYGGLLCALDNLGGLRCWDRVDGPLAVPVGAAVAVSAGDGHACALDAGGAVVCFGDDSLGQASPPR